MNALDEEAFSRVTALTGTAGLAALRKARVAVIGTGGVGAWCAEALVRSGVGGLLLVDDDAVAASNLNRQLPAVRSALGRPKAEVLRERFRDIHPTADVAARLTRYTPETAASFAFETFDAVVDAIDSVPCKAHLIRHVTALPGVRLYSSMGAAGRFDPSRIRTTRFEKVEGDGLARALRQRFRKDGAYPARPFLCTWSDEPAEPAPEGAARGSWMPVTASFGLHLAAKVLDGLRVKAETP